MAVATATAARLGRGAMSAARACSVPSWACRPDLSRPDHPGSADVVSRNPRQIDVRGRDTVQQTTALSRRGASAIVITPARDHTAADAKHHSAEHKDEPVFQDQLQNVGSPRAERHANADFMSSLCN